MRTSLNQRKASDPTKRERGLNDDLVEVSTERINRELQRTRKYTIDYN